MDLKNITKEQITKFCDKFNCGLGEFKESFNGSYYLQMFTGYMGPQPEFKVTENYCVGINYTKGYNLTEHWIQFLNEIAVEEKTL